MFRNQEISFIAYIILTSEKPEPNSDVLNFNDGVVLKLRIVFWELHNDENKLLKS